MKLAQIIISSSILLVNSFCLAAEVSNESLAGTWKFTHMILDGDVDNPSPVNVIMEFSDDGHIINKYGQNVEVSAEYRIEGDEIVYSDKNGEQHWKVVSFSEDEMHVNNSGAEMFFERE